MSTKKTTTVRPAASKLPAAVKPPQLADAKPDERVGADLLPPLRVIAPQAEPASAEVQTSQPPLSPAGDAAPAPAPKKAKGGTAPVVHEETARYLTSHLCNYFAEADAAAKVPEALAGLGKGELVVIFTDKRTGDAVLEVVRGSNYSDRDAVRSVAASHGDSLLEVINQTLTSIGLLR